MKFGAIALAALSASPAVAGCGGDAAACQIATGEYHAVLPADPKNAPVVVFLHGAGSHGGAVLRNSGLVEGITDRGYALLAPTASRKFGNGNGTSWNFYPAWEGRDETAFLKSVVDDASDRLGTSPDRVLLAGFSAGAFMVTYLACDTPDAFDAYAPVAGGFWEPQPDSCAGPVDLFQTHGWQDGVVPLEGRSLGGGRYQQGDIMAGLDLWRDTNQCDQQNPETFEMTGDFWRRSWECDTRMDMVLFPGGHRVPQGWSDMVLDWFEALES